MIEVEWGLVELRTREMRLAGVSSVVAPSQDLTRSPAPTEPRS